jgi:hypothetical protein
MDDEITFGHEAFSDVARSLMSGRFVCEHTHPDSYMRLEDVDFREDVDAYLGRIRMRLARVRRDGAYFATSLCDDVEARLHAKRVMQAMRTDIATVVHFLKMTMEALKDDQSIAPGYVIFKSQFVTAIADSPSLTEELRSLAHNLRGTPGKDTIEALMEKVLRKMCDLEYLDVADREKGAYLVTGKIDYAHAIIGYLAHRLPAEPNEETETPRQESLL